ncbi:hypothetical protein CSKR_108537 [Clonorchis sinensis]|uniref:Uncharacterized protein n=1 Tax=Clonorchis sinensis TaxID=79923 RepID=A0A419QHK5_CLOSI|nr:hypothetical protein CSKR_108537 [Clonorchis sinensis]
MRDWQSAFGQNWVMIGCWVQTFNQPDLNLTPDRPAFEADGSLAVVSLASGSCLSSVAVVICAQAGPSTKQLMDFLRWCRDQKCPETSLNSTRTALWTGSARLSAGFGLCIVSS